MPIISNDTLQWILFISVIAINVSWIIMSYTCYKSKYKETILYSIEDFKNFRIILSNEKVKLIKFIYHLLFILFYLSSAVLILVIIFLIWVV